MILMERILFFGSYSVDGQDDNPSFSPAANGFQWGLLQNLQKLGVNQIEAITLTPMPSFPKGKKLIWPGTIRVVGAGLRIDQVAFLNLKFLKPISQSVSIFWRASRLVLGGFRPDILLTYNAPQRWALPALLLAWLLGVPAVCIAADVQPLESKNYFSRTIYHLRSFWFKRFDGAVLLSSKVATRFLEENQTWMHLDGGILPQVFEQFDPCLEPEISQLYYAGTLSHGSGIHLLLNAFALLPERYHLWITGTGPLLAEVRQAARRDDRIQYFGLLPRQDQLQRLHQAGMLINPRLGSLPENRYNFPSKLLEYLASGRPVVSTLTADVAHEYADKLFVCPQETPEALAATIEQVVRMDGEVRKRKALQAREYVLREKNWERQAERIYRFLQSLVDVNCETNRN